MAILISDSFKIRESTSDEWEDILFSINSPGVPAGGSAGQVLKKQSATDYDTAWGNEDLGISGASVDDFVKIAAVDANGKPTAFGKGTPSGGDVTADMLGIVIDGNSTPVGASVGQYVIVKNSTISGITDGLYTAAQAIPVNTAIDATYLTAVIGGGLNSLKLINANISVPTPPSGITSITGYVKNSVVYLSITVPSGSQGWTTFQGISLPQEYIPIEQAQVVGIPTAQADGGIACYATLKNNGSFYFLRSQSTSNSVAFHFIYPI